MARRSSKQDTHFAGAPKRRGRPPKPRLSAPQETEERAIDASLVTVNGKRLLDYKDLQAGYGLSKSYVCSQPDFPRHKIGIQLVGFFPEEIEAWIRKRSGSETAPASNLPE